MISECGNAGKTVGNRLERSNSFTWICFFFLVIFLRILPPFLGEYVLIFVSNILSTSKSQQHEKSESIFNPQMETILDFFIGANTCIY